MKKNIINCGLIRQVLDQNTVLTDKVDIVSIVKKPNFIVTDGQYFTLYFDFYILKFISPEIGDDERIKTISFFQELSK